MKGLEEYINVHGNHFTEKLALDVSKNKWDISKIEKSSQSKVYYNVTGSTIGDMVYMMDMFKYFLSDQYTNNKCITLMLKWVGDHSKTGSPFCIWLSTIVLDHKEFDFTSYI